MPPIWATLPPTYICSHCTYTDLTSQLSDAKSPSIFVLIE